jgi:tRNA dimethylallyltransferase
MQLDNSKKPLIILLGPTAVGKTALSLKLAKKFNGEIVSADSRLFYRGMDIGTAKPSEEEQREVHHYLIDIADPADVWSLGRYKRAAQDAIAHVHEKGKVPFLVGGTGQYLRAITEGWVIPERPPDDTLRKALRHWADEIGPEGLYARLKVVDPVATEKILPGNVRRTIRALEVIFHTGRLFSAQRAKEPVPYEILQVGLNRPRPMIDARIEQRVDAMMEAGFLDEVRGLLEQGIRLDMPSMSAIGYRQLGMHLLGEVSYEEAVEETKRVTKKFYRRQMTWFKLKDDRIAWFDLEEDVESQIFAKIEAFLKRI